MGEGGRGQCYHDDKRNQGGSQKRSRIEVSREPQSKWLSVLSVPCQLTFLFVKFSTTRYNYISSIT